MKKYGAKKIKVLVIDDSSSVRTILEKELSKDPDNEHYGYISAWWDAEWTPETEISFDDSFNVVYKAGIESVASADKLEVIRDYHGIKNITEIIRFLITKEYREIKKTEQN